MATTEPRYRGPLNPDCVMFFVVAFFCWYVFVALAINADWTSGAQMIFMIFVLLVALFVSFLWFGCASTPDY